MTGIHVRQFSRIAAAADNVFWSANLSEAGHFIHGFESAWLPSSLLRADRRHEVTDALLGAARHSTVELHFQRASPERLKTLSPPRGGLLQIQK